MARRRYRRFRRRRGRWSPNIVKVSNQITATNGEFFASEDLAVNPIQSNTGVSQTFTVKNVELTFTLNATVNNLSISSITAYIMYVPQGMNVTSIYYLEHPEYILAYKYLGSPDGQDTVRDENQNLTYYYDRQNYQPYRVKTRLSRKLQTGDKIILFIQGSNSSSTRVFNIDGIVRWWSKAN